MKEKKFAVIYRLHPWVSTFGNIIVLTEQRALIEECRKLGITLTFFGDDLDLAAFVRNGEHRSFAGLIGFISAGRPFDHRLYKRIEHDIPCVNIFHGADGEGNHVGINNEQAMASLVDHLCEEGHSSIGFASFYIEEWSIKRFRGYRDAMIKHKLPIRPEWLFGCDPLTGEFERTHYNAMRKMIGSNIPAYKEKIFDHFLSLPKRPQAIMFENDRLAYDFILFAAEQGVSVPGDIAVTGFDNINYFGGRNILTSVHHDFDQKVRSAAHLLNDIIRGAKTKNGNKVLLGPKIIVRESSLKRSRPAAEDAADTFRRTVLSHVDANFSDPDELRGIARETGMSYGYFLKKFRATFGVPFTRYVNDRRIERAAELLRKTDRPVTRILIDIGYNTHQNFNKFFKRRFGMKPLDYRAAHRKGG